MERKRDDKTRNGYGPDCYGGRAKWSGWVLTTELISATWPPFSTILLDLAKQGVRMERRAFCVTWNKRGNAEGSLASI